MTVSSDRYWGSRSSPDKIPSVCGTGRSIAIPVASSWSRADLLVKPNERRLPPRHVGAGNCCLRPVPRQWPKSRVAGVRPDQHYGMADATGAPRSRLFDERIEGFHLRRCAQAIQIAACVTAADRGGDPTTARVRYERKAHQIHLQEKGTMGSAGRQWQAVAPPAPAQANASMPGAGATGWMVSRNRPVISLASAQVRARHGRNR